MTSRTNYRHWRRSAADPLARLRRIHRLGGRPGWRRAQRVTAAQAAFVAREAARSGLSPDDYVALLPQIRVQRTPHVPVDAIAFHDHPDGQWAIHVRSSDTPETQRFAILREFKRILDQALVHQLYSPDADLGHQQARLAAEEFAARVLMPARELKAAVHRGPASHAELAHLFGVAPERITKRLIELDLAVPSPGEGRTAR